MINRISFSGSHLSIDYIWEWYEITKSSLEQYRNSIKKLVFENSNTVPLYFYRKSLKEIDEEFQYHLEELENVVCLNMIAAIEARLRIEYLERVYKRKKDDLSRDFREIYKNKENRIRFEEDILNTWMKNKPNIKTIIDEFKNALKYRHWLAHGRYWKLKDIGNISYDAYSIYCIADNIVSNFDLEFS